MPVLEFLRFCNCQTQGNVYDLTVDFKTSSELYEIIDFFKSRNVEIVSIEKQMVNFEKIFISYTKGNNS